MDIGRREMEERIRKAIKETEMERERTKDKRRGQWDNKCGRSKEKIKKESRNWKKEKEDEKEYKKKKKEYKKLCERKKKKKNDRWEKKAAEAGKGSEVWEVINKERKRGERRCAEMDMGKWKEYFIRLLGGVEHMVVRKGRREKKKDEVKRIQARKIKRIIGKLKDGKAAGIDWIPSEAWKYGREKIKEWMWNFCNRVQMGKRWPESWREEIIAQIVKKRDGERVDDHRGSNYDDNAM